MLSKVVMDDPDVTESAWASTSPVACADVSIVDHERATVCVELVIEYPIRKTL